MRPSIVAAIPGEKLIWGMADACGGAHWIERICDGPRRSLNGIQRTVLFMTSFRSRFETIRSLELKANPILDYKATGFGVFAAI